MSSARSPHPLDGFSLKLNIAGFETLVAVEIGPDGASALGISCMEGEWFRLRPTPSGLCIQRFPETLFRGRIESLDQQEDGTLKVWIRTEANVLEPYELSADGAARLRADYRLDVIGLLVEADPNRLVPLEPPRPVATAVVQ